MLRRDRFAEHCRTYLHPKARAHVMLLLVLLLLLLLLHRDDQPCPSLPSVQFYSPPSSYFSMSLLSLLADSPRCVLTPGVVGAALGQVTNVTCRVEADPPNVTFMWSFSNAARHSRSRPIDRDMYTTSGLTSVLQYKPTTVRDYGTLSCYANNTVGTQREPCTFTLVTAGPPERVTNCSVFNVTSHTAEVSCSPGFNGGLPQSFLHQVRVADTGQVLYNVTSDDPGFVVKLLGPGRQYEAVVMAYNGHGNSRPAVLPLLTLTEADMHKSLPSRPKPRRLVWVLGVVVGVVVGVAGAAAGVWWVRGRGSSHTLRNREDCMTKLHKPDLTDSSSEGRFLVSAAGIALNSRRTL
ncbi:hypothetical protein O3P69_000444 [Scylla paramamosain]|uniref:Ig-like domain-containing protein n=1 Tax=Scylla paramamosain TaxID=85552 RepID=A0AAW0UT54_SCYPA